MKYWFTLLALTSTLFISSMAQAACQHEGVCSQSYTLGPQFISPKDGDTVSSPLLVKMGIKGMRVHKAGEIIEGTGHHHLIIDGAYIPENEVVPADDKHIHFGKGQTETTIKLKPGKHTLTLQFADGHHQSYGQVMSRTIHITVK
ncbi:DUF4399 domain-containing protein [Ghiorsea bivora]|uniref:DUF4399 domain-containing protein n=1 Tax=Ghiorsea bivora TaxID=1485545 RepID=UPI001E49BAA3|nr:DUF4399 domain-containing protein [Ghiorsea bivora]